MTDKKPNQKLDEMSAFMLRHLQDFDSYKQDQTKINGVGINFLKRDDGLILLINKIYTADEFHGIIDTARAQFRDNVAVLFYKDGTTYFRNAVYGQNAGLQGKRFKQEKNLSLKRYTPEQVRNMIQITKPEGIVLEWQDELNYYQPKSTALEEGIVAYNFKPVTYDYSHIPPYQFRPTNRTSSTLVLLDGKELMSGPIKLKQGLIVPAGEQ